MLNAVDSEHGVHVGHDLAGAVLADVEDSDAEPVRDLEVGLGVVVWPFDAFAVLGHGVAHVQAQVRRPGAQHGDHLVQRSITRRATGLCGGGVEVGRVHGMVLSGVPRASRVQVTERSGSGRAGCGDPQGAAEQGGVAEPAPQLAFQAGDGTRFCGARVSLYSTLAYFGSTAWDRFASAIVSAAGMSAAHSTRTTPAQGAPGWHGSRRYQECRSHEVPIKNTGVRSPAARVATSPCSSGGR